MPCVSLAVRTASLHELPSPVLQMPVFRYDEEEWEHLIEADPGWSRAETDYLLDMCERFELRFLVIADRYEVGAARGSLCVKLQASDA